MSATLKEDEGMICEDNLKISSSRSSSIVGGEHHQSESTTITITPKEIIKEEETMNTDSTVKNCVRRDSTKADSMVGGNAVHGDGNSRIHTPAAVHKETFMDQQSRCDESHHHHRSSNNHEQHYSLRWNNHQNHVLSAFDTLLQNDLLLDCTLVCEDFSFKAHKVVLSACSTYFQQIFVDNPSDHPVIVLKDVGSTELQCLVDFMYKGLTFVPEGRLASLMRSAESLKIRGLTSGNKVRDDGTTISESDEDLAMKGNETEDQEARKFGTPSPTSFRPRKQARPRRCSEDDEEKTTQQNEVYNIHQKEDDSSQSHDKHLNIEHTINGMDDMDDNIPENLSLKNNKEGSTKSSDENTNTYEMAVPTETRRNTLMMHEEHDGTPLLFSALPTNHMGHHGGSSSNPGDNNTGLDFSNSRGQMSQTSFVPICTEASTSLLTPQSMESERVRESEARAEALQALNFMACGGGLPMQGSNPYQTPPTQQQQQQLQQIQSDHLSSMGSNMSTVSSSSFSSSTNGSSSSVNNKNAKAQHSAPRGGPPRAWTNDELTDALQNVWNKKMTTSQASRVFSIPYNSLLMYVRGKYGKSLKLDTLKMTTAAGLEEEAAAAAAAATTLMAVNNFSSGGPNGSDSTNTLTEDERDSVETVVTSRKRCRSSGGRNHQQTKIPKDSPTDISDDQPVLQTNVGEEVHMHVNLPPFSSYLPPVVSVVTSSASKHDSGQLNSRSGEAMNFGLPTMQGGGLTELPTSTNVVNDQDHSSSTNGVVDPFTMHSHLVMMQNHLNRNDQESGGQGYNSEELHHLVGSQHSFTSQRSQVVMENLRKYLMAKAAVAVVSRQNTTICGHDKSDRVDMISPPSSNSGSLNSEETLTPNKDIFSSVVNTEHNSNDHLVHDFSERSQIII